MEVLYDNRWEGKTGIGKLAGEIMSRTPLNVKVSKMEVSAGLGSPLTPIYLQKAIIKSAADIFYSPSFMPPLSASMPFVFTIHDLLHVYYHSKFHKWYFKQVIGSLAKNAKKIITVSEYTKTDILAHTNIPEALIEVVYNGLSKAFADNEDELDLGRPYFLYIGNRRKHKNLHRMIKAFAGAKISEDYLLAISGDIDDDLKLLINQLNIADRVVFLGIIGEADLPALYKGAFALLYVSMMEGFGLPLLEAMASKTPVITSSITSLPEIAGNAAILVDPFSVPDIKEAIESITSNQYMYEGFVELGIQRSKLFNWDETAAKTWDIILK